MADRSLSRFDLTGQKFGRLTVIRKVDRRSGSYLVWECACECGAAVEVASGYLRSGSTKSCGCLKRDITQARATTHGKTNTPEFVAWCKMRERCSNPNKEEFKYYGGRGIGICALHRLFGAGVD